MMQISAPSSQPSMAIKETLVQFQSADAAVRNRAQELLNESPLQEVLPTLAAYAALPDDEASNRQLAAVLLRRLAHTKLKEGLLNQEQKHQVVQQVLQNIMGALSPACPMAVRKAAAEAIGELWRHLSTPECIGQTAPFGLVAQWLEMQKLQEQQEDESILWLLLDRLADTAGPAVYVQRAQQIVQKLKLTLEQQILENVAAAEEALATLFSRTLRWKPESEGAQGEKSAATAAYCSLCPFLLHLTAAKPCPELLAPIISLAEHGPQFFRGQHQLVLESVKGILTNPNLAYTDEARQMAMQLGAVAFIRAPKFARKNFPLVKELLIMLADVAARASCDEQDPAAWEAQAREEETPEETIQTIALELIAEITSELYDFSDIAELNAPEGSAGSCGNELLDTVMNILSRLMQQNELCYSLAALELLAILLENDICRPLLGKFVRALTEACIAAANSLNPRLRWGGLRCLGLMLQHDEPWTKGVQQEHGAQLLQLLSQKSAEDESRRCRRQALLALAALLSGFAPEEGEDPPPEALALIIPHMNGVLSQAVIANCSSDDLQTQEFALALASALAKACGTAFIQYYPPFAVALRNLLGGDDPSGQQKVLELLQEHSGRCLLEAAVEFAADLGAAVGKEIFKADAPWLVDRLHRLLIVCNEVPAASAIFGAVMTCLAVAAPACGPDSLHEMQPLMELVLKKAKTDVKVGMEEELGMAGGSLNVGAEISEAEGVSKIRVQDKTGKQTIISINTAAVEERVAALRLLGALASALGTAAPNNLGITWTGAVLDGCSSEFTVVRRAAFEALPACFSTLARAPEHQRQAMTAALEVVASFLLSRKAQLLPTQVELASENILPALAQILAAQAKLQRDGMLPEECKLTGEQKTVLLEKVFAGMGKLVLPILTCEFERLASNEKADDEWEDLSDDDDDEESASSCYDSVMQCVGGFFKVYGSDCVPHFDAHLQMPYGALLAHENASFYGKVSALCLFADAINFGGAQAARSYSKVFLPAALLAVCPPSNSPPQEDHLLAVSAAAYGLGAVAQRDPETFATRLQPSIEAIEHCLANPALQAKSARAAADCAACALLKILAVFGPQQDLERFSAMLAKLLEKWFPLVEDEQEIVDAHELLLNMVIHGSPLCGDSEVQQQLRRLIVDVFPDKPELLGEQARRENLLQAAKEKLC